MFLSIYKSLNVKNKYLDLNNNTNNCKAKTKITIKFQPNFENFKTFKKIDIFKIYFFHFLKKYLINKSKCFI